ncbi:ESPR-type extended signal peptide-containing protein, partial [Burkholderia cenocepacia]
MNKSYRTVWNATTGTWAAAPETARMRTKSKSNATMKSSVTAAVAVMTGVGGGAVSLDAMAQAANGNGSLVLCGPTSGPVYGESFGSGSATGTRLTGGCIANPSRISQNREIAFQLYNHSNGAGGGVGQPSAATEAGISGSKNGHLVLLGGSGVHIVGPADFDNNVNMTNHQVKNLAAGTAGTDAVNLNQLNSAIAAAKTPDNPYVVTNTGTYAAATAARAGTSGTAVGANANAGGISAVALGGNTVATGQNAVALGTLANATGSETVAVGVSARATANNATAVGRAAAAASTNTTSVGYGAYASGDGSTALGTTASAVGANAIAVGRGASTSGTYGSAIGYSANATTNAVAIGVLANAASAQSVALGERASATGATSTALGRGTLASGTNAVALGANSVADRNNAVSVGSSSLQRQITNVAAGTANTDAVNLGQMNTAIANSANPYLKVNSTGAAAVAGGGNAVAVGQNSNALAGQSIAMGNNALTSATSTAAVALGSNASAIGDWSVALGGATQTGRGAVATGSHAMSLGTLSQANATDSVALGYGSVADRANTVSVGASVANADGRTFTRQIVNVGAGTQATDAVNVSQLKGVTDALGGGAGVGSNGSITNPTYKVGGTDYHNVGDALDALAASGIGNPNAVIYDDATKGTVTLGGTGATAPVALKNVADAKDDHDALNLGQLKNAGLVGDDGSGNLTSLAVTYDGATKDSVTLGGAGAATPVALHNVADGVLSATSKDAVNGSQLFATNTRVGDLEDSLSKGGVIDPVTGESLA